MSYNFIHTVLFGEFINNINTILASDEAKKEDSSNHKDIIRRNFMWLSEKMDIEYGLISLLYQQNVLTVREREFILGIVDTFQRKEFLLGLLSKKSVQEFDKFLEALEASGQSHLTKRLRKPEGKTESFNAVFCMHEVIIIRGLL